MTSICLKRQTIISKKLFSKCFYSINKTFIKSDNNLKLNKSFVKFSKQNKQTFDRKIDTNCDKYVNKKRTEEVVNFDHRLSDIFGTLSGYDHRLKRLSAEDLPEDDDGYDVLEIKRGPKMAEIGYKKLLNHYINRKPIQMTKALELYQQMVSEDRIPPHVCTYSLLINGCARVGFTEKAFELFEELLKYELRPTKPTITALFNACAECPFPEYGLQKARYLKEWMTTGGYYANNLHYHSMIKAFGKLGDIQTAFEVVNEMVAKGQAVNDQTFAMLMIACISNKESGLYDAIKLLHRMRSHNIPLTIYIFNLLLRAVRDCGLGSEDRLNSLINSNHRIRHEFESEKKNTKNVSDINSKNIRNEKSLKSLNKDSMSLTVKTPNILLDNSLNDTNIIKIDFNSLTKPFNRLMLFGGIEGFVEMMSKSKVKPNINTLTLMTELIDFREQTEKAILDLLERFEVKADTDLFNVLMKRTCLQNGMIGAKHILSLMIKRGLQPDIATFGILSLSCNTIALGHQLLKDIEEMNIRPNIQIMGALMSSACKAKNFYYINYLIDYMKDNDIKPDQKIIEILETIKIKTQKTLSDIDWQKSKEVSQRFQSEGFRRDFNVFKHKFQQWIQSVEILEDDHKWLQFQIQQLPNKKGMHSFVKFMKQKIQKRRGMDEQSVVDEYEEDELYND